MTQHAREPFRRARRSWTVSVPRGWASLGVNFLVEGIFRMPAALARPPPGPPGPRWPLVAKICHTFFPPDGERGWSTASRGATMITHAPRRPSDRAGRWRWSGQFGLSAGRSWHRGGTLAGLPMALLLALSALFVGGVALPATVASAATSVPAVSATGTGDPAWSQLGAATSRTWASAGLAVNFAASGDLRVSNGRNSSANWSLAPSGLGRGQIEPLEGGADAPDAATRTYDNGQLSVWYSPTATGLEQGFTLNSRPAGTNGAVTIAMASAGGLTPVLTSPYQPVAVWAQRAGGIELFGTEGDRRLRQGAARALGDLGIEHPDRVQ